MAWASRVAVVVPSPATSLVLVETSRTRAAPMFSKGSSSSISLAMVTPSLVIRGEPYLRSSTTLRPLGPRVTLTVSASLSTPASRALRASSLLLRIFAIIIYLLQDNQSELLLFHDSQDVVLTHDGVSPTKFHFAGTHDFICAAELNSAAPRFCACAKRLYAALAAARRNRFIPPLPGCRPDARWCIPRRPSSLRCRSTCW